MSWIDTKQILPQDGQLVIVCTKDRDVYIERFFSEEKLPWHLRSVSGGPVSHTEVLYWMPTPPPPPITVDTSLEDHMDLAKVAILSHYDMNTCRENKEQITFDLGQADESGYLVYNIYLDDDYIGTFVYDPKSNKAVPLLDQSAEETFKGFPMNPGT